MQPVTLLLCGSRALDRTPEARTWACDRLREALAELPAGSIVVTGDATGPDTWASEAAKAAGLKWLCFFRNGDVIDSDGTHALWSLESRPSTTAAWRQRLLARDRAMASFVGSREGPTKALGLVAPWPPRDGAAITHGTEYTLGRCRAEGVAIVTKLTCPADLGPSVPHVGAPA